MTEQKEAAVEVFALTVLIVSIIIMVAAGSFPIWLALPVNGLAGLRLGWKIPDIWRNE